MKKLKLTVLILALVSLTTSFKRVDEWVLCETKNCKVLFPAKPEASSQMVNSAIGTLKLDLNVYEVPEGTKDDNFVYLLAESEYPDSLVNSDKKDFLDNFFRKAADGAVKNVQGRLLTENACTLGKFPGREIRIDFQNGKAIIKARMYLVKNILVMLETITDPKLEENKSVEKFMNSIQLTR